MQTIETSTIYHTLSGDIEVPSPSINIPDVQATYESNLAPQYLVFPDHVFNVRHVYRMTLKDSTIIIATPEGEHIITGDNIETTWKALQKAFAEGVERRK